MDRTKSVALPLLFASFVAFSGCGGGGGSTGGTAGSDATYKVSVITSGLNGSGLSVGISSDAGIETMSITSNGTQSFSLALPEGSLYTVGIGSQPSGQSCSISGNIYDTSITSDASVTVTCINNYSIGGDISGLSGEVELSLNGGNWQVYNSDGPFILDKKLADGELFAVSVHTQPDGQVCVLTNSGGQVSGSNVNNIGVNCAASTPGYKVGGLISGLDGLIKLSLNSIEEISKTTTGSFEFASNLATGDTYSVTVSEAPVGYQCQVQNGNGTIASSDYPFVEVDCVADGTSIKPKVDPYGADLWSGESMTVTLNGVTDLTLDSWDNSPVSFSTALAPGDSYEVTIKSPPAGNICILYNSVGVIEAGVTPVISTACISDTVSSYTLGGSVTGLTGDGLVLGLDGRETLAVAATSTSYTIPDALPDYTAHYLTILSQPSGQICSLSQSNPVYIWEGPKTDANIVCSSGPHSIGGSAIGITTSGLKLTLNGEEELSVPASGDFQFTTLFSTGMRYEVSIASQPADQVCSVHNATGWNISASVSDVLVECKNIDYAITINVSGYSSSTPLLLQLNDDEILEVTSNTRVSYPSDFVPHEFATRLAEGEAYSVTIAGQPSGQLCYVTNSSGIVATHDTSDIGVVCASLLPYAGPFTVNVSTSGLVGSGLTLQLNAANDLAVTANGYSSFIQQLSDATAYTVTVSTQPSFPLQHCKVVNGSGTIAGEDVTDISVQCGNAVQSLYPTNGGKWLDYVKNNGADVHSATDEACDSTVDTGGYDTCLSGGEYMVLAVPSLVSCTNVTATDYLGAFDWVCDDSDGVRILSNGLKVDSGLSDLVDFTESAFKPNYVTVYANGVQVDDSQPAVWWTNPVITNHTSQTVHKGEIHLVNAAVSSDITMYDNSAVLVKSDSFYRGNVSAASHDYLWFEGSVNGALGIAVNLSNTKHTMVRNAQLDNNGLYGLSISGTDINLRNISATSNASKGINVSGDYVKIENVTANSNFDNYGIDITGYYLSINNLTASENIGYGGIKIMTSNSEITNLTAENNSNGDGVVLTYYGVGPVSLSNVIANGNGTNRSYDGHGINITSYYPNYTEYNKSFSNLTANNNLSNGIYADADFSDSSFTGINVSGNGEYGARIDYAENSTISDIHATFNGSHGLYVWRATNSTVTNLYAANNKGSGINLDQSDKILVNQVSSSNNSGAGYWVSDSENVISTNILATNNGTGITLSELTSGVRNSNVLIAATAANNTNNGFNASMGYSNVSSILSLNNGGNGFVSGQWDDYITVSNLLSANNSGYGILEQADYGYYTGLLEVGTNALGDCNLDASLADQTGLVEGGTQNKPDNTCVLNGFSDANLITGIDGSSSVVAKITTDDLSTPDDDLSAGSASFADITDWFTFDNIYRAWGLDGTLAFADASNQGACNQVGDGCRIWDWSTSITDTGNSGLAAANNVVALPSAFDELSMTWNGLAADQAYCDSNFPGSIWDGGSNCVTTYLRHAQEIYGDGLGNENGLCEKGETCLYMPNIGVYQGHGAIVDADIIGSGTDTIILKQYDTIGR